MNIPGLSTLKPPLEENSSKVKTERHTKLGGQSGSNKPIQLKHSLNDDSNCKGNIGLLQLSHHKNKKTGEILLQIP